MQLMWIHACTCPCIRRVWIQLMPCTSAAVALSTGWCPWVILYHGCWQGRGVGRGEEGREGERRRREEQGSDEEAECVYVRIQRYDTSTAQYTEFLASLCKQSESWQVLKQTYSRTHWAHTHLIHLLSQLCLIYTTKVNTFQQPLHHPDFPRPARGTTYWRWKKLCINTPTQIVLYEYEYIYSTLQTVLCMHIRTYVRAFVCACVWMRIFGSMALPNRCLYFAIQQ